jgi:hypothetical protein
MATFLLLAKCWWRFSCRIVEEREGLTCDFAQENREKSFWAHKKGILEISNEQRVMRLERQAGRRLLWRKRPVAGSGG